jgi:hypothetical protein
MADETLASVITAANVKGYIWPGETITKYDTILATICSAVILQVQAEVGCDIQKGSYTSEEVSGTGHTNLDLKHWPILTVTTVTDTDSNTYTVGATNDYTIEPYCLRSTGTWAKGYENFIVTYTAGWGATIPKDIVLVCYELVAQKWKTMQGKLWGETSRNFPDGSVSLTNVEGGFTKAQLAILAKYKRPRV